MEALTISFSLASLTLSRILVMGIRFCIMLSDQSCLLWNIHAAGQKWAIGFIRVEDPSETQTPFATNIKPLSQQLQCIKLNEFWKKIYCTVNKFLKIIYFNIWNEFCKHNLSVTWISKKLTFRPSFKNIQLLLVFMTVSILKGWDTSVKAFLCG